MESKQARDERMLRLARQAALKRAEVERHILDSCGKILPAHRVLLDALVDVELTRLEAAECVAEKGQRERYSNGRQTLERKAPEVDTMLRASATEAKLIAALGLRPRKPRGEDMEAEEAEDVKDVTADEAPSLDDY